MRISHIMFISVILIDLFAIRQKHKNKKHFADIACSTLVMKEYWYSIKRFL